MLIKVYSFKRRKQIKLIVKLFECAFSLSSFNQVTR